LPEPQKEAHAILSLFPLLALLCWPSEHSKDEGCFQGDLMLSGSGTLLTPTLVGKNPNTLGTVPHISLLSGHSGWQDHTPLPSPLSQLFPHPV